MIDIAVLAGIVVSSFLVPYVKLGAEKLAEAVGDGFGQAAAKQAGSLSERLWQRVKGVFQQPKEQTAIELFEGDPEGLGKTVERILVEKLRADPELAAQLNELVNEPVPGTRETGASIMNAAVAGIVDARHANIHGGIVAGVYNPGGSNAVPPTPGGRTG